MKTYYSKTFQGVCCAVDTLADRGGELEEGPRWPVTARIKRPLSFLKRFFKRTRLFLGLRSRVPGAQGQCGCTSSSPSFFAERDDMMEGVPQNEYLTHTFTRSPWS